MTLTDPQVKRLRAAKSVGANGYLALTTDRTMRALERKGMVVQRADPNRVLVVYWVITDAGTKALTNEKRHA